VSDLGPCPNCDSQSITRAFPVDRRAYFICDDCKRSWRPKPPDECREKAASTEERLVKLEELIAGFTGDVHGQHYQMKQRIERLERAFVQFAETPLAGFSRDFLTALKAIRQDLAEMDRQRQPKETP